MAEISLEALALDVEVSSENGKEILRVARIEGHVKAVREMLDNSNKKYLRIHLDPETQKDDITQLNFYGTSPVRGGDKIRAGLILNKQPSINTLYLEIVNERGHYLRRDFSDEYRIHVPTRELGLEV